MTGVEADRSAGIQHQAKVSLR
eukprot:COSAG02_NODE_17618_length_991_cov_1.061659_1_plen_21_part_10